MQPCDLPSPRVHSSSVSGLAANFCRCLLLALWHALASVCTWLLPAALRAKNIAGQVAVITGAGSGIGRLLALRLARRGAYVVLWDIDETGNNCTLELIRAEGLKACAYTCDVSSRDQVYSTAMRVKHEVGKVDILVNNAAIVKPGTLLKTSDNDIVKTFEVNAISHFWTTKAFLADMFGTNRGHVVSVSSIAGLQGTSSLADYCASKFSVVGFHESLAVEILNRGLDNVHTTLICPFLINTNMFSMASSQLVPFLDAARVADRICRAILLNEEHVVIPGWMHYLFYVKLCMNHKAFYYIGCAMKLSKLV